MKSFPYLGLAAGSATVFLLAGCGTPLGNLNPGPLPTVTATPTYSPAPGTYSTPQTVTISDATPGATIYYTTDGSIPTQLSRVYTGPILVRSSGQLDSSGNPLPVTISAIAVVTGDVQSQIGYGAFNINIPPPKYVFKNVTIMGGGFVDGVFFHPAQKGLMYARTDLGGAYRWLVGSDAQWVPLTDFISPANGGTLLGVESVGLDPTDAKRLFLSMGEFDAVGDNDGEFEISDDQGATFTEVDAPFQMGADEPGRFAGERFGIDPQLDTNIWYGTRNAGLYMSADRGKTWTQVTSFPATGTGGSTTDPGAGVIFEAFVTSSGKASGGGTRTIYAGFSDPTTPLFVTNDGGITWSAVANAPTGQYPNAYVLSSDGNLYITFGLDSGCVSNCTSVGPQGISAGSVWKYTLPAGNSGGTWTNITPPDTDTAHGYSSVTVDPKAPKTVMVTTIDRASGDEVYRSLDGGATWAAVEATAQRDSSLSPWVNFGAPSPTPGTWLNHLTIDPFNSAHAMYGNGQTVWQTTDVTDADGVTTNPATITPANPTKWSIGAQGIENSTVNALSAPPSSPLTADFAAGTDAPNELFAGVDQAGSFSFPEATIEAGKSPASGQDMNPLFANGTGVDFAGQAPLDVVRVGTSFSNGALGGSSSDGGVTWMPFSSAPSGITTGGGSVALSADGSTIVWFPSDSGAQASYSTDGGATWTASSGSPNQTAGKAQILVYADRQSASSFYMVNPTNGNLYLSTDGGKTFATPGAATPPAENAPQGTVALAVNPLVAGDVWVVATGNGAGIYQSLDGGNTFTQISALTTPSQFGQVASAFAIGFGAPDIAEQSFYPTVYISGSVIGNTTDPKTGAPELGAVSGVFRSIDAGYAQQQQDLATWVQINSAAQQWGGVYEITGDLNRFGRVYMGTNGRGVLYGDSPN